ncbi:CDP-glycerol glycerophosphotransferase family protein [Alkalihalobacillus trypoxylicola]|uniref:TarS C-terminal domain-containing protein n=1 Tax=Alkalihalobacillus trypoxylicola TaxID=519424 RepID=A0A162DUP6_9BACI|nr:CDP-glycerol glycerophosphotransferase family protein [Alkalihalobacillus trypoxylicola]KYG30887.1 hypothetical protein AZF04_18760 [Alkalihalobacillus trypoxylicola]
MIFSNLLKRKQKGKGKLSITIKQELDLLTLKGELQKPELQIVELWIQNREESDRKIRVATQNASNQFDFTVSLKQVLNQISYNDESAVYDWFFKIKCLKESLPKSKELAQDVIYYVEEGLEYTEYFIRCGRFFNTSTYNLNPIQIEGNKVENYITAKGNLSLIKNGSAIKAPKIQIDTVKSKNGKVTLKGHIYSGSSLLEKMELITIGRQSANELISNYTQITHVKEYSIRKFGLNKYAYKAVIDIEELNKLGTLREDIYDLYFNVKFLNHDECMKVRIGKPTKKAKLFTKDTYLVEKNDAIILNPYYTFKLENLSFEIYHYEADTFKYLKTILKYIWIVKLFNSHKNVWLVGERTYKAQDTGYAFFKYMRQNHPEKNVYYVIENNSPEKANVEPLGNVLKYKSKEHILKTIIAKKIISSHHADYLYPLRTPLFKKKIKATTVFLQHGVMGTKNMVANYGRNAYNFDTDLFMVSSDFEKKMIVNDFGYNPKDVFITGLSRFDQLFAKDVTVKRQILIIPTWRDWIVNDQKFLESEYYERYRVLTESTILKKLADQFNFEIVFCLHPNMQNFSKFFSNTGIKVVNQGEVDVQYLIKESAMMITDYSSVGFDFSFLYKPIVYYQFDRAKFIGKKPSHLDLDNDLPGEIVFELEKLLLTVEEYAKNNFKMKDEYRRRADKFIKYRDQHSSDRIYNVIQNNVVRKRLKNNPHYQLVQKGIYNRFRKSRLYFPIMKFMYKLGKNLIPVDKKLILFESGIGKQLGDSPKNIYDEIIRQGLDYKKVWVYNKQYRFEDNNTKVIKRLSPQYYYYLLRARYWVNNQNFPSYLDKRKETTYLQTWHGTPLKRMLFDIENVQGRSDDYVERIGKVIQYWDYLISPSRYATNAFKSAFKFKGSILELGYPRNDIFYSKDRTLIGNAVLNRLHLPSDKKVILYAPTFRDNQTSKKNKFLFDIKMDLHQMKEALGDEYIILLRMHVVIQNKLNMDESLKGFVYNVSSYPDIQELQLISDILITDYSSVMFDFANTGKPILFFTYDLAEYRDNIRGFYMEFEEEAPGPLLYNTNEIIKAIKQIEQLNKLYEDKYNAFQSKYCALEDGNASERIVSKVFK